jgi:hypothetical protein
MSSLSDRPELVGFFSYSREDDEGSKGALSKLRKRIWNELRAQLGRTRADFRLWQDTAAIPEGRLWEEEIQSAIEQSVFFIPIITPTALRSVHCKREFDLFLSREAELGRNDLIFPLLYIRVPALEAEDQWRQNPVLKIIGSRQYIDWLSFRHLDIDSTEVGVAIERFCTNIFNALHRSWVSPEDRRRDEEAAALRRAEDDERRTKAEAEARERAAEERRRQEAAAKQRTDEEETRRQAEREASRRRAEEARARLETESNRSVAEQQAEAEFRRPAEEERGHLRSPEPPRTSRLPLLIVVAACIALALGIGGLMIPTKDVTPKAPEAATGELALGGMDALTFTGPPNGPFDPPRHSLTLMAKGLAGC